ncbi:cytochrome c [Macrococcoides goetzii]|uniref:Cytochrome c n=1 Tax=Macrococcoides goetzii TaxID=1891097 RepID=A0A2G5NT81_9STAP|nr:cytochrome c [Macrococcus goetzii]RAI82405.1 cytochrome c [Macrococcus goetzii]
MNRNPVIPFLLIMLMGVGLIFFMSAHGANKAEEEGEGGAKTEQKFDAKTFAKDNCTSCHGQNLEGGMGPKLAGISDTENAKKIIREGKGAMPAHDASQISDKDLDTLVKYLKEAK